MTLAELQEYAAQMLATQMRLVEEEQAKTHGVDNALVAMSANLARSVAALTGEVRKREAHSRRMVGEMTEDEREALVKAYIAGLPKPRRDQFRKYLEELE